MTWKKNKKKWENKIMGHWGHTEILFLAHLVTLKRFRRDNFNKILEGRSGLGVFVSRIIMNLFGDI
jgi:hypothetical protein